MELLNFTKAPLSHDWEVVNDAVMGGHSRGHFTIEESQPAVFHGTISLEDNGGFSLVRYQFEPIEIREYRKALIRLRGDGKRYQFRVKSDPAEKHAYVHYFPTNGDWQTVEVRLTDMYPTYKGKRLEISDFPGELVAEVGFLIGNNRAEHFHLELERLELK